MSRNKRWWLWLPLLGAAAWLALFSDKTPPASEAVVRVAAHAPASMPSPGSEAAPGPNLIPRDQLVPATSTKSTRDLFAARSWTPPPPASVVAETVTAPTLPFTFLGKKFEGDSWEIYLARGDQTLIVKAGAVIDGTYRVDSADPPTLVMTYLPLKQFQTLAIGDPQ
jgi:hypothetical protein